MELARYYREAHKLRRKQRNEELWLQGLYIYEAILDVAPVLHPFARKGTKPTPYREEPHELFPRRKEKREALTKEQKSDRRAKAMMEMMMVSINRKFERKGGEENGS